MDNNVKVENQQNEKLNSDNLFNRVELKPFESERLSIEPYSYWQSVGREFFKKTTVKVSFVILLLLVIFAIFVPMLTPLNFTKLDLDNRFVAPNFKFFFGTDSTGRDLFGRVFYGLRTSLIIALSAAVVNTFLGVIVGSIWGYFRQLDIIMIEVYNFVTNIPMLLQMFVLVFVLRGIGVPSIPSVIIGMTMTGWVGLARFLRNRIIVFNNREYNIASRTLGSGPKRIIMFNMLPQILTVVITTTSLAIPGYIGTEVTLAYFGVGLRPTDTSLGIIIKSSYAYWVEHPHVLFAPVAIVVLFTVTSYLIGLALSDAVDPKTHR